MSKRDSSAMAGGIIGFIAGSATSAGETASLNLTSEQFFTGDGLDDTSSEVSHLADSSTDIADGNTALLTTILGSISGVAGSSGGSSEEPVVEIFTNDQGVCSEVEKRAKGIFDKYNSKHVPEKPEGATLIASDPQIADLVKGIAKNTSKTEIIMAIGELREILNNNNGPRLVREKNGKPKR